jgi:hypothetical protein
VLPTVLTGTLFLNKNVEQLTYADVLSAGRRPFAEVAGLALHCARLVPDGVQAQRANQPGRLSANESSHIVAAQGRDMVAEFLTEEFQEGAPVGDSSARIPSRIAADAGKF